MSRIESAGLRWQSVIVSPQRLPWMAPPSVPADPKFTWWERLRQVDCAWVSNRGESERFLYYDGPTAALAPVAATYWRHLGYLSLDSTALLETPPNDDNPFGRDQSFVPSKTPGTSKRVGLFIQRSGGHTTGIAVTAAPTVVTIGEPSTHPISGEPALAAALLAMLTTAGLTDSEAAGLVDCWRPQLFHTDGSRFLLLMTAADYDALCPIRIDPPPTELVRVGLVLTEFGA